MKTDFERILVCTAGIVLVCISAMLILMPDSVDSVDATIKELNCKDDRGVFIHNECIIKTDNGWERQ